MNIRSLTLYSTFDGSLHGFFFYVGVNKISWLADDEGEKIKKWKLSNLVIIFSDICLFLREKVQESVTDFHMSEEKIKKCWNGYFFFLVEHNYSS